MESGEISKKMSAQVTTSVGNYPVAPDTSTGAFFDANPGYSRKDMDLLVNGPRWETQAKRYARVKGAYDSWASRLSNQYDSDIKTWEAAYNSPYNQSELLEAAGYNRNWLQGSAGSQVGAGDQIGYTPSDSKPIMNGPLDAFGAVAGTVLQGLQSYAQIKDTLASSRLKDAQALQINELMPFKAAQRYFDVLPHYSQWYGFSGMEDAPGITHFQITPSSGIGIKTPDLKGTGFQTQQAAYTALVLNNETARLRKTSKPKRKA